MSTATGAEDFLESVVEKRVEVGVGDQEHRPARPAVSAARAAARDELLAAESQGAAAPMAGRDVDIDFVYEHAKGDLTLRAAGR